MRDIPKINYNAPVKNKKIVSTKCTFKSYKDFLENYESKSTKDDQESVSSTDSGISDIKSDCTSSSSLNSENGTSPKVDAFGVRTGSFRNYLENYNNKKFSSVKPNSSRPNVIKSEIVIQVNGTPPRPPACSAIKLATVEIEEQLARRERVDASVPMPPLWKAAEIDNQPAIQERLAPSVPPPPPPVIATAPKKWETVEIESQPGTRERIVPPPPPLLIANHQGAPKKWDTVKIESSASVPPPPPLLIAPKVESGTMLPPSIPPPPPPLLLTNQASPKKWATVEIENQPTVREKPVGNSTAATNLAAILTQNALFKRKAHESEFEKPPSAPTPQITRPTPVNHNTLPRAKAPEFPNHRTLTVEFPLKNAPLDAVDYSTTTVVPIADRTTSVKTTDPNVKKLVYSTYRGLLGAYNHKANDMIATLPRTTMVKEDRGISKQLESLALQGGLEKLNGRINRKVETD